MKPDRLTGTYFSGVYINYSREVWESVCVCVSDTGPETTFFIKIYNAIENFEVQREKRV